MSLSLFDKSCREVKFWTKLIVAGFVLLVGALYYSIKFLFTGRSYNNSLYFGLALLINLSSKTINLWRILAYVAGFHVQIHGTANQLTSGPRVVVVNHQSVLDILALIDIWPKRSTFVAKRSIGLYASFGVLVWFLKAILIDRSNKKGSISRLKDAAEIVKNDQVSVIIFPEGTRGGGANGLLPFKKGAFHLAVQAQVPIQPVVISHYSGFDLSYRIADGGICDVFVLPCIPTTGLTEKDVDKLVSETHDNMAYIYRQTLPCRSNVFSNELEASKEMIWPT